MSTRRDRRRRPRRVAAAVAMATVLCLGACSDGQDPGLDQQVDVPEQETRSPSNTLGPCPEGGPDAATPEAGCLDAAGDVVRP